MPFYDLPKDKRTELVTEISKHIQQDITKGSTENLLRYFADEDTYIRKSAYLSVGRIYCANNKLKDKAIGALKELIAHDDHSVRQTVINAAGEIGRKEFESVADFFDEGLFDKHHAPRNAVIGSIKKMGAVNPVPVLQWAKKYLHHPDKEIRREICHGIELRGRKYPLEIMPLLKELQFDKTARVRNTLVHVIGQIAYKDGCLKKVVEELKTWENKKLVTDAFEEIIDVHHRYKNFASLSQDQAKECITLALGR